jgi:hydroxycarboxylate dehydrogenase B
MVTVALRNCGHLGRIGDWPEIVAAAGLVSLHFVNTSGFGLLVAPFGGIDRRLSANPIAAGVPRRNDPPIVLDISTCSIAEGKIKVARNRGQQLPENCVIDHHGRPTVEPKQFYADPPGALLPFGGHKGYGLSVITELLAGALTGGGCSNPRNNAFLSNGMLSLIMAPGIFGPRDIFDDEVEQFVTFLKSSRRAEGVDEVLLPGEIEQRTRATRLVHGLDIDQVTWSALVQTARAVGVDPIPAALKEG